MNIGIKWKMDEHVEIKKETQIAEDTIDGNKMVFCKLDNRTRIDAECVSDWTEDIGLSSSASINYNSSKTSLDDEAENLRKQISFIQQNI